MDIVVYGLIFWAGLVAGYVLKAWLTARFKDYSGTIVVDTDDFANKTVYSLVLDDYPEKLEFKKEVVFRIDSPKKKTRRR